MDPHQNGAAQTLRGARSNRSHVMTSSSATRGSKPSNPTFLGDPTMAKTLDLSTSSSSQYASSPRRIAPSRPSLGPRSKVRNSAPAVPTLSVSPPSAASSPSSTTTAVAVPIALPSRPLRASPSGRGSVSRTASSFLLETSSFAEDDFAFSSSISSNISFAPSSFASNYQLGFSMDEETCDSSLSEPDLGCDSELSPFGSANLYSVPAGTRVKSFVGEGAANVVVELELPQGAPATTKHFFQGKLLRLQKDAAQPEKQPYGYPEQYRYWRERIQPIFVDQDKDDLVNIDLVRLGSGGSNLLDDVDHLLEMMDNVATGKKTASAPSKSSRIQKRKMKFVGSRLARVEFGMLVDDMRIDENEGIMIEIKPKWLVQSPSAPADAVRCRNCAVRLRRHLKDPSHDSALLPCPLLMTAECHEDRNTFVSRLFADDIDEDEGTEAWYVAPLRRWFRGTESSQPKRVLERMRKMQKQLDLWGPLGRGIQDDEFRLAMTLRDCSVFLRIMHRPGGQTKVVAKIADLDKKNSTAKMDWWRKTELDLVHSGAYTAEYRLDAEKGMAVPAGTSCYMEMQERRRKLKKGEIEDGNVEFQLKKGMVEQHNRLIRKADLGRYIV